jgi:predicted Zn-dependent protease
VRAFSVARLFPLAIGQAELLEEAGKFREGAELMLDASVMARDLAGAWRHLDRVDSDDLAREAQDLQRKIEEVVSGRLRDAQALAAIGEKAEALESYREILREFPGLPAAEQAKGQIEALKGASAKEGR